MLIEKDIEKKLYEVTVLTGCFWHDTTQLDNHDQETLERCRKHENFDHGKYEIVEG